MSDMIKREDVLRIIDGRFSGMMIGDILKQDINALPEAEARCDLISRCELFNRLATITAEDANEMKAKIYAVIQEIEAGPDIVRCKECKWAEPNKEGDLDCKCHIPIFRVSADDFCSYGEREGE